jgi:GAF domain-containing protein
MPAAVGEELLGEARSLYEAGDFRGCWTIVREGLDDTADPELLRLAGKSGHGLGEPEAVGYLLRATTVRDETISAVEVINKRERTFTDFDAELVQALANEAAIAIDNARLYAKLADPVVTSRMSYRL